MIPISKWQTNHAPACHSSSHCAHPVGNAPIPRMHCSIFPLVHTALQLWCMHLRTMLQLLAAWSEPSRSARSLPTSTQLLGKPVLRQHQEPSIQPTHHDMPPIPFVSASHILVRPGASAYSFPTAPFLQGNQHWTASSSHSALALKILGNRQPLK